MRKGAQASATDPAEKQLPPDSDDNCEETNVGFPLNNNNDNNINNNNNNNNNSLNDATKKMPATPTIEMQREQMQERSNKEIAGDQSNGSISFVQQQQLQQQQVADNQVSG